MTIVMAVLVPLPTTVRFDSLIVSPPPPPAVPALLTMNGLFSISDPR